MVRIALVDDDPAFLATMNELVTSCPLWEGTWPQVELFGSADDFLRAFEVAPFDLAVLDVVMPERSGIEAARLIYQASPTTLLAFVSSSREMALNGYGVDAVAYLLKPVTARAVRELIREARARRARRAGETLILKVGRAFTRVNPVDIIYLESDNKRVYFHFWADSQDCAGKLDDFLEQLPAGFVRVHKSYAVNLDHVRAMRTTEMITDNGRSVPISRRYRISAEKAYLAAVADEVKIQPASPPDGVTHAGE